MRLGKAVHEACQFTDFWKNPAIPASWAIVRKTACACAGALSAYRECIMPKNWAARRVSSPGRQVRLARNIGIEIIGIEPRPIKEPVGP